MPIVDRGGLGELGDQLAGLLYSIASSTSTVRRGGLSTSTSATWQLPRRWLRVKRNTVQYFHKSRLLLVLGYLTTTH
jgi:hypothetical protein